MTRVVKTEPDSNGAVGSVELKIVDSLNKQKLFHRLINKTMLFVENEIIRFSTEKTNKGQDDTLDGSRV